MARPPAHDYQRPSTGYDHLGISHAVFHRWLTIGKARQSPPPFDDPGKLPAWYAGMQSAGAFTKALPSGVRIKLASHLRTRTAPAKTKAAHDVTPAEYQGLEQELQYLRQRVSQLRSDRDKAYSIGDVESGDVQDLRYREVFQELTIAEKRVVEVLEKREALVLRSDVEQDLGPRIAGIALGGMFLYPRVAPQLDAIIDAKERANAWKNMWREHCQAIMTSDYAPEFIRGTTAEAWQECADWLEAKHKAP